MLHHFTRLELLVGEDAYHKLKGSCVAVFGVGGVGSYAAEALARAAVGKLVLVDFDLVCATNVNRQLHALASTIGQPKTELMAERIRQINPDVVLDVRHCFYQAENSEELLSEEYDYVLDCIDNITAKMHLIASCVKRGIPVISAMGAACRRDPTKLEVADIVDTHTCPFARVIRKALRTKYGVKTGVKTVFSTESPTDPDAEVAARSKGDGPAIKPPIDSTPQRPKRVNGTISYLPAMIGLMMAGVAIQDLMEAPSKAQRQAVPAGGVA